MLEATDGWSSPVNDGLPVSFHGLRQRCFGVMIRPRCLPMPLSLVTHYPSHRHDRQLPMTAQKLRRNDPCSCGSGKKYKQCCHGRGTGSNGGSMSSLMPVAESSTADAVAALLIQALAVHQGGDHENAASQYHAILRLTPDHPDALHLLGLIDFHNGDDLAALHRIESAIRQSRKDSRYFYNLGTVLMRLKRPHDAIAQFRTATEMDPGNALALGNLGAALRETGEREEAIVSFRAALKHDAVDPNTWANLCVTLIEEERTEEATACLETALALDPQSANALHNIGFALQKTGDPERAAVAFARALEVEPRSVKTLINLGSLLMSNPMLDEPDLAVECFREAVAIEPDNNVNHSSMLMAMQYSSRFTPEELFSHHRRFAAQFEKPLPPAIAPARIDRDPERRLRIGYVSPDLYNHAVATFIDPILRCHDRARFEIFCYYSNDKVDATTVHLRSLSDHWIDCKWLSDEALAAQVATDCIDILVDLTGHSASNRLMTFARKPAPLQATWIGYPGTSGLESMDYYLADRYFLPEGVCDDQFSEKIIRLPVTSVTPHPVTPDVSPLPALRNGFVTFGSFNQLHKFTGDVVRLWSTLLRAVPNARLLVGAMPSLAGLDALIALFAANGVERNRLEFHLRCDMTTYLQLHHEVDICLDTFPYSGGTTTVHALWMGVPTLTLAGKTAAGRQGCGLPCHLDLLEYVAQDAADFVAKGVSVIADLPALALIRNQLRERFVNSPVCSAPAATTGLETAFRMIWRRWCDGLPPVSFDVPCLNGFSPEAVRP